MIRLRALEYSDVEYLYYQENQSQLWEFSNLDKPVSKEFIRQIIEQMLLPVEESKQLRLMAEIKQQDDGWKPIGTVELFDIDMKHQRAEVGIIIYEEAYRYKGYGREVYHQFELMIQQHLPIHILYSHVLQKNQRAINFFTHHEFQQTAILEQWLYINKCRENVVLFTKILH